MLALIAHDAQKGKMFDFVRRHINFFKKRRRVATGKTGELLSSDRR